MKLFLAEVAYLGGRKHYRIVKAINEEEAVEKINREYAGGVSYLKIDEAIE